LKHRYSKLMFTMNNTIKMSIIGLSTILFLFIYSCKNTHKQQSVFNNSTSGYTETTEAEAAVSAESLAMPMKDKTNVQAYTRTNSGRYKAENNEEDDEAEPLQASIINKKKIIKNGRMTIQAIEIEKSKQTIDTLCKKMKAYFDHEDFENNLNVKRYNLTIRIPSQNFEPFITALENGNDEIREKSIEALDVTEEYVDIETRLNSKKSYLKRYTELLSKASTIKDIIELQENIRNLQEEIESKEGQLKLMSDQIDYSTLSINLYKEKPYTYKPEAQDSFWERIKNSLHDGWKGIIDIVIELIGIWPLLLIIPISLLIGKRYYKKYKIRKAK
jgi:flagellar biosynthesis chaperone FliJ